VRARTFTAGENYSDALSRVNLRIRNSAATGEVTASGSVRRIVRQERGEGHHEVFVDYVVSPNALIRVSTDAARIIRIDAGQPEGAAEVHLVEAS
jgi:hypothetical protein